LFKALQAVSEAWRSGERHADALRGEACRVLDAEPLAETEYVSVADPETLEELAAHCDRALVSMAVRIGRTRLIDNIVLGAEA
jgi:pantoate--beta-alanine ligase